jgi:hypothetical protein
MRSEGPCCESDLETIAMADAVAGAEVVDFIVLSGMYEPPFFHRAAAHGVSTGAGTGPWHAVWRA